MKTTLMCIKYYLLLMCGIVIFHISYAQEKVTISGKITDAATGEDLIGATIANKSRAIGTITNMYGFYSLTISNDTDTLYINYIGYNEHIANIAYDGNQRLNIKLSPSERQLDDVVITATSDRDNVTSTDMGVLKVSLESIEKLPVLFGERDIMKTLQLLPGISSVGEGSSNFSVRGGSYDQNLIQLDESTVYSASHLLGFFSTFNSDAIKNVTVYKGGIPANYGGRGSSVVDIQMKDGNNQAFSSEGGIGIISSRLAVEGPIIKDKMSFLLSGRRTYLDLLAKSANAIDEGTDLFFYDLNAKVNYQINDNNRVYLSGYFGKDKFGSNEIGTEWDNTTATVRWNHLFSDKLFSNATLTYSNYGFGFNIGGDAKYSSGIEDLGIKQDFSWFVSPESTVNFGWSILDHSFQPGKLEFEEEELDGKVLDKKRAYESGLYLSHDYKLSEKWSTAYGVRFSMYNEMGSGWTYQYDDSNVKTDSVFYSDGEIAKTYFNAEPRVSVKYQLSNSSSFKLSYNRMAQYLHLLSNSTSGQPTDTWISSSSNVKPLTINQYSVGYFKNFNENMFETSVEIYYKGMDNITDYEDGTNLLLNENIEAQILSGQGRSYGAEFYVKKKTGRFTGWLSYTLARTEKQIEGINNNHWYATTYDKTHDLSVVGSYEVTKRLSASTTWIYGTGSAVTFPNGKYQLDGKVIPYYSNRNDYRMPAYHRMDINFHLNGKKRSSWDFSIYNLYNRHNAYSIDFEEDSQGNTQAVKTYLFGIIPSLTWNFKF